MKENLRMKYLGKTFGFGIALSIFVSVLYYINNKSNLINLQVTYKVYITIIVTLYISALILLNLIKKLI